MSKKLEAVFAVIDGAMFQVLPGACCGSCHYNPAGEFICRCVKGVDHVFKVPVAFKKLTPNNTRKKQLDDLVGTKYTILDAATGKIKSGKYFVLRIDARSRDERRAVRLALEEYAVQQDLNGRQEYAGNVLEFIGTYRGNVDKAKNGRAE